MRPRLFLITPFAARPDLLAERVGTALAAGDVASVLIDPEPFAQSERQKIAQSVATVCAGTGVATLVRNDSRITGRVGADGIHVDTGLEDVASAVERFRPGQIVGAAGVSSRHDALQVGDMDVDYIFFGRLDRTEGDQDDQDALDLAAWWSPIVEIPCVVMAAATWTAFERAVDTGAEFVGIRSLVWDYPDGPGEAVRKANDILDRFEHG